MKNYIVYDIKNDKIYKYINNSSILEDDNNYKYIEYNINMKINSNIKYDKLIDMINNYIYTPIGIESDINWQKV